MKRYSKIEEKNDFVNLGSYQILNKKTIYLNFGLL